MRSGKHSHALRLVSPGRNRQAEIPFALEETVVEDEKAAGSPRGPQGTASIALFRAESVGKSTGSRETGFSSSARRGSVLSVPVHTFPNEAMLRIGEFN